MCIKTNLIRWVSVFIIIAVANLLSYAQPSNLVRTVDNNYNAPTGPLIYTTIQEAVDASNPGDVIYIQPSPKKYGSATTFKRLDFKGIGFALDKDQPHISQITNISLQNNVDNTQNASSSTIEGVRVDGINLSKSSGTPEYTLSNITISNCQFIRISVSSSVNTDNLLVAGNYITSTLSLYQSTNMIIRNNLMEGIYFYSTSPSSAVVSNNIIYGSIRKDSEGDNLVIQHNNFIGAKGSSSAFATLMRDAIIVNNIFYGRTPSVSNGGSSISTNFQRNIFTNNLSYETGNDQLPPSGGGVGNSGDGNIIGSSPLFVNVLLLNTWSDEYDFTLQGGSPALAAGSNGQDVGISGGPYQGIIGTNFSLRTTRLPTIQIFNTSTVINPGDGLNIRVKAKTN